MVHFNEIGSTHQHVLENFGALPPDQLTMVSADFQTDGVGKGDRKWASGAGKSVLVTFAFQFPSDMPDELVNKGASNVTHVLALSAVSVLRGAVVRYSDDAYRFQLKWPNDVIVNGKKMGGLLARAQVTGNRVGGVIVSIGLNINGTKEEMDAITRPVWPAGSLLSDIPGGEQAGESPFSVQAIRDKLAVEFFHQLDSFCRLGFAGSVLPAINRVLALKGKKVAFNSDDRKEAGYSANGVVVGVFEGLDSDGALLLRTSDGATRREISGEIVPLPDTV